MAEATWGRDALESLLRDGYVGAYWFDVEGRVPGVFVGRDGEVSEGELVLRLGPDGGSLSVAPPA